MSDALMSFEAFNTMDGFLIAILGMRLALVSTSHLPATQFRHRDTLFDETGLGEMTGFYDWLRSSDGNLIGIRYLPMWGHDWPDECLPQEWKSLPYAIVFRSFVEIYFGPVREWDEARCIGGEWSNDWVFRSADGCYALSFSMRALDDTDRLILSEQAIALAARTF